MAWRFRHFDGRSEQVPDEEALLDAVRAGSIGPETHLVDEEGARWRAVDLPELAGVFGPFAQSSVPQPSTPAARPKSVWPSALEFPQVDEPAPTPRLSLEDSEQDPLSALEDLVARRRVEKELSGGEDRGLLVPVIAFGTMIGMTAGLIWLVQQRDSSQELSALPQPKARQVHIAAPPALSASEALERELRAQTPLDNPLVRNGAQLESLMFRDFLNLHLGIPVAQVTVVDHLPAMSPEKEVPTEIELRVALPVPHERPLGTRVALAALALGRYTRNDRLVFRSVDFFVRGGEFDGSHIATHQDIQRLFRHDIDSTQFLLALGLPVPGREEASQPSLDPLPEP